MVDYPDSLIGSIKALLVILPFAAEDNFETGLFAKISTYMFRFSKIQNCVYSGYFQIQVNVS